MDHEVQSLGKAATLDAEPSFTELQGRISGILDGPSVILGKWGPEYGFTKKRTLTPFSDLKY